MIKIENRTGIPPSDPSEGHIFTPRRFSCDHIFQKRDDQNRQFGTLQLGRSRRLPKKDGLPSTPVSAFQVVSPQPQRMTIQQQWQLQQQIIFQRQRAASQQQAEGLQRFVSTPTIDSQTNPQLLRATSLCALSDPSKSSNKDEDCEDCLHCAKDTVAVGLTIDRRRRKGEDGFDTTRDSNTSQVFTPFPRSSTLPNLNRSKFKSESNLREEPSPPALPPRNNPFRNAFVRDVCIEKQNSGDYGIAIDYTHISANISAFTSHVQNFPVVSGIDPKGSAAKTNLRVGDFLLQINSIPVEGLVGRNLGAIIKSSKNKLHLLVATLPRGGKGAKFTPSFASHPRNLQRPLGKSCTLDRVASSPNHLGSYLSACVPLYEELEDCGMKGVDSKVTRHDLSPETAEDSRSGSVGELKAVIQQRMNVDGNVACLSTATAIVGQRGRQLNAKSPISRSENSSGFVSEADSPENSSGSSMETSGGTNKIADQVHRIDRETNKKCLEKMFGEKSESSRNAEETPPPLPPKRKLPTLETTTSPVVYQNGKKLPPRSKPPVAGRSRSSTGNLVSVAFKMPTREVPVTDACRDFERTEGELEDDVFMDGYSKAGIRIIFPKPGQRRRSIESLGCSTFGRLPSKNNPGAKVFKTMLSGRSGGGEDSLALVLAPPEDFADSECNNPDRPRSQSVSIFLTSDDDQLHPTTKSPLGILTTPSNKDVTMNASETGMESWSLKDVLTWLRGVGIEEKVVESFAGREVNGKALLSLKRADFIALGMTNMEDRRDLERAIKRIQLTII